MLLDLVLVVTCSVSVVDPASLLLDVYGHVQLNLFWGLGDLSDLDPSILSRLLASVGLLSALPESENLVWLCISGPGLVMLPRLESLRALGGRPQEVSTVSPFDKLFFVSGPIELDRLEARDGVDGKDEDIGSMSDKVRSSFTVSMHLSMADTQLFRMPDVMADST